MVRPAPQVHVSLLHRAKGAIPVVLPEEGDCQPLVGVTSRPRRNGCLIFGLLGRPVGSLHARIMPFPDRPRY